MRFLDTLIDSKDLMGKVHGHQLIKKEDYDAREGDLCYGCGLLLHKSSVIYHCINLNTSAEEDDCAHLFLHKICAHLPLEYMHPSHKKYSLELSLRPPSFNKPRDNNCDICGIKLKWFTYRCDRYECKFQICVSCVIPINNYDIHPPYHPHKLTLLARLASFRCDGCHEVDTDFSYMCYTCSFWIHLTCSSLPSLLTTDIHQKHPLILAYSLPKMYCKFPQTCRLCKEKLDPSHWLYYCPNCRFFEHIKCATSPPPDRWTPRYSLDDKQKFVDLPLPEYESLLRQCFRKGSICWLKDAAKTPLDNINHWSHEHQLLLKNKSVLSTTEKQGIWPICNGCNEFIFTNDDVFYECRECDYILHIYCAQFPKEMNLDTSEFPGMYVAIQPSVLDIWSCTLCEGFRNGTQMQGTGENYTNFNIDSRCAALFRNDRNSGRIKHEAWDFELLYLVIFPPSPTYNCDACLKRISVGAAALSTIDEFNVHVKCALKPLSLTHRWDPHPLCLIFSPEEVTDHPHEFNCEFCSEEIDTNGWFYHCNVCDLSFHFGECIDYFFRYSKIKFGATNIKIEAHQHGLTFVLNKKRQPCQRCHKNTYGEPVLECAPCKFIQHAQSDLCSVGLDG